MNTSFEKSKNSTDEWYTPKEIIDALGEFDLDPCAPMRPLWRTARVMYNKEQDGLKQKWEGRVWLNPPYSRPTIEHFITRMVEHNNGIALLFNRLDNKMFQDVVFPKAKGILFMKGRIKFHREDGTIGESPGCGSILVAFGEENAETLRSSNIEGRYIQVNQEPCNTHVDWEQRRYEMAKTMLPITSVSGRGPHGELILEPCLKGEIEVDETYIGGKNKNRHSKDKVKDAQGRSLKDKTPVFGTLQREGFVVAYVVTDTKGKTLLPLIYNTVHPNSTIYSDEWYAYNGIDKEKFDHQKVYHKKGAYVIGRRSTNTIEGYWSHLKKMISGTHFWVSRKHLQRYVDCESFRYNTKHLSESERFDVFLQNTKRRLRYSQIN